MPLTYLNYTVINRFIALICFMKKRFLIISLTLCFTSTLLRNTAVIFQRKMGDSVYKSLSKDERCALMVIVRIVT
jgi:hypothetical protein